MNLGKSQKIGERYHIRERVSKLPSQHSQEELWGEVIGQGHTFRWNLWCTMKFWDPRTGKLYLIFFSSVAIYIQYCFVHDTSEKRAQERLRVHGGNGKGTVVNTKEELCKRITQKSNIWIERISGYKDEKSLKDLF